MTGPETAPPETPKDKAAAEARRSPLWMRAALFVSLALNLAVVGIVAGALAGRRTPEGPDLPRDPSSALYLRALPGSQREALQEGMRHEHQHFRVDPARLRAEAEATLSVLRADPFDPAAFAARIAEQRRAMTERVSVGDRLLVERLAAMKPGERQAYADRLERALDRVFRGRRD